MRTYWFVEEPKPFSLINPARDGFNTPEFWTKANNCLGLPSEHSIFHFLIDTFAALGKLLSPRPVEARVSEF